MQIRKTKFEDHLFSRVGRIRSMDEISSNIETEIASDRPRQRLLWIGLAYN